MVFQKMPTIIERFAKFAADTTLEDIPKRVIEKVKLQIITSLTASKFSEWHPEALKIYKAEESKASPNRNSTVIPLNKKLSAEERRKKLVSQASKTCEETRATVRNVRKDAKNRIKGLEKDKEISEDEASVAYDELQELTDKAVSKIDEIQERKQKELMEF